MSVTRTYSVTIPANAQQTIPAVGNFVRVMAITTGAGITVETPQGDKVPLSLAEKFTFVSIHKEFYLYNPSGSPVTVTVLIGVGNFEDRQIVGSVVIGDQPVRVKSLLEYQLENEQRYRVSEPLSGVASNNAHIQLLNPAASGRSLLVTSASYSFAAGVAEPMSLRVYNTALTNDESSSIVPCFVGSAVAPVAEVRDQNNIGVLGSPAIAVMDDQLVHDFIQGENYLILPEGSGILIACSTVNISIRAEFAWSEF